MARITPSRPGPTGLPDVSQYVQPISRADQSTVGGAPGSVYSDPMGNRVSADRIPQTLDSVAPPSRTSPLGQPQGIR